MFRGNIGVLWLKKLMLYTHKKLCARHTFLKDGFSLVELLVTLGIMTVMMGVLFLNYGAFSSRVELESLSYEVALAFREAQVYGVAVKESTTGAEEFPAYGVNVSMPQSPPPELKSFELFADTNPPGGDGVYTEEDRIIEVFTLERANFIGAIRGCTSSCAPLTDASITFLRPNLQARFNTLPAGLFTYIEIELRSARPDIPPRFVRVWNNGQIAID